jgi:hypothetical protein
VVSRSMTEKVTSDNGVPMSSNDRWTDRTGKHMYDQGGTGSEVDDGSRYAPPVGPTRYRCDACGNLTRFDVIATLRTRAFHHYAIGGELEVEDVEKLSEVVEDVVCRWCGSGAAVTVIPSELVGGISPEEA